MALMVCRLFCLFAQAFSLCEQTLYPWASPAAGFELTG